MPRRMAFDRWLFLTTALLVVGGLFMVGSASNYVAVSLGRNPYHFLMQHAFHVLAGACVFAAALLIPYERLADRRVVVGLIGVSAACLVAVLFMSESGGARRWLRLGFVTVQPSEFAKLAVVVSIAFLLSLREREVNDLRRVPLPCLGIVAPLAFLIVVEPDLGTALMIGITVLVMIFVAGLRWKYLGATLGVGFLCLVGAVLAEPYRIERVISFFRPGTDPKDSGFQLDQSLIALGNGGITGTGWGQGQQKALYLPAAHTDFIFSVVGEELGLLGTTLLLGAFVLLFWRGMRTALRAPDRFGSYLALGITCLIVLQGLIHMGVCLGMLPTKGLPLPFVSAGGSSLVATLASVGVLLNVSQHSN